MGTTTVIAAAAAIPEPGGIGGRLGQHAHLLLEGEERGVVGWRIEGLDLRFEVGSFQLCLELGVGFRRCFDLIHFGSHAVERVEGAAVRDAAHRLRDLLLRFRPLGARDEEVLLALGLVYLALEAAERFLELVYGSLLRFPLLLVAGDGFGVLGVALQGLGSEIVPAGRHGLHGLLLPVGDLPLLGSQLLVQAALVGHGRRDLLLGLAVLGAHILGQLIEHLLRVFGLGDHVVDVSPKHGGDALEDRHVLAPYPSAERLAGGIPEGRQCWIVLGNGEGEGVNGSLKLVEVHVHGSAGIGDNDIAPFEAIRPVQQFRGVVFQQ